MSGTLVNGNLKTTLMVVGSLITVALFILGINANLENKFDAFVQEELREATQEEHRFTQIEGKLDRQEEILQEIRRDVKSLQK